MWQDVHLGFRALGRGFRFLARERRLWKWALIPWCIQLGVLVALLVTCGAYFDTISHWLLAYLPSPPATAPGLWGAVLHGVWWAAAFLLELLVAILGLVIALGVAFLIGLLCAGPFHDLLSEKTEQIATGREEPPFTWRRLWGSLWRSLLVESQKAFLFIGLPLVLLCLHLIPVIGSLLSIFLIGAVETWATGFAFLDYPMGRRLLPFGQRLRFAWRHRWGLCAFGAVFWVPGFIIVCAPPLVVGGTLLYLEWEPHSA